MSVHKYDGEGFTVTWDKNVCIHAAECVRGLPTVFDVNKTPWVQPNNASPEAVEAQVQRCPSGALGFVLREQES